MKAKNVAIVLAIILSVFKFVSCNSSPTSPSPPTTKHTLSVQASPSNGGSVAKSPDQTQYAAGTVVTLTATPAAGYTFSQWQGDATGSTNPTTITMNANKTVTAVFAPAAQYTLSVQASPSNGGSVAKSPDQTQYAAGTVVTLAATPAAGYTFSQWQGDATGSTNPMTITMDANRTVTAVFAPAAQYTLSVQASPSNGGSVAKSPDQTQYAAGTVVTLAATPAAGYAFSQWQGDATGSTNPTTITMNANKTVTAVFAPAAQYTLSVSSPHLTAGPYRKHPTRPSTQREPWSPSPRLRPPVTRLASGKEMPPAQPTQRRSR